MLEPVARPHRVEPGVLLAHEIGAVGVRAQPEGEDLRADDREQRAADQGVDVPAAAEEVDLREDEHADERAERGEHGPRQDEEVGRAVHQQEAQVAPPVAEARELRLAAARVVLDLDLGDLEVLLGGADHHLGGELHPGRAQVELVEHVAAQRAHAAVGVAHAGAEEEVEQPGQQRVADVAVQPRHRSRLDVPHAVAHHQLGAGVELADEARDLVEVVGQVGVGHHDVAPARGGEPGEVRAAVAAARLDDHARPGGRRELRAAVIGVVVDDDHLAVEAAGAQALERALARSSRRSPPR